MPSGRRCVVIGAGLLGLSAACSLSRRGWSVEVLEAADSIGHALAGSKGDARIFRLGYPEPQYVEMAIAARALWRELEASTGRRLLHVTGQLSFGDDDAVEAVAGSLAGCGEAVERLSAPEAHARFPGVVLPGPVLVEPQSGVLAAGECLQALVEAGRFEVQFGAGVVGLEDDDEGVTVRCAGDRTIRTEVVVDCAGPGAWALLGTDAPTVGAWALLGADAPTVGASPSLPQVAYFAAATSGAAEPPRLPVFIEWGDAMIYGLPVPGAGPHAGTFKVSHHTPGPALLDYDAAKPAAPSFGDDPALLAALTDAVRRVLPGLDPVPVATERCVYDNSVDGDFVLDRVGHVVVGCGTSGHGFKFGPLLGELLADLAEAEADGDGDGDGTAPRFDLRPFRLDRHPHPHRHRSDQPGSTSR